MLSTFHAYGSVFGLAISSTFLLALGILNLYTARQLWMEWKGRGGDHGHDATMGLWLRCCPRLFQAISKPWHMLIVGFLFGLGFDTSTEVGLLGVVAVSHGLAAPVCILLLPLLFMSGMCLLDTLNGLMMAWIYRTSAEDWHVWWRALFVRACDPSLLTLVTVRMTRRRSTSICSSL